MLSNVVIASTLRGFVLTIAVVYLLYHRRVERHQ